MAAVQEDVPPLSPTLPQNILQDFGENPCEVVHCQWSRPSESSTENFSSPGGGGGLRTLNSFPREPAGQEWCCVHQGGGTAYVVPRAPKIGPPWNSEPAGVFQEHPQIKVTVHPHNSWSSLAAFPHPEQQTQQISPEQAAPEKSSEGSRMAGGCACSGSLRCILSKRHLEGCAYPNPSACKSKAHKHLFKAALTYRVFKLFTAAACET